MEYDLKTPEREEICNLVRFAVNRNQLTQEHMVWDYNIVAVKALYEDRASIPNYASRWDAICRCGTSTPF